MLCFNKFYYLTHPRIFMMTYGRICNHEVTWCSLLLTGVEQMKDEEEVERQADEVADGSLGDRQTGSTCMMAIKI